MKTPIEALKSEAVQNYLETLRDLIAIQLAELPGIINVSQKGEIRWDERTAQIILPIFISVEGHQNLAVSSLQTLIQETADLYFEEIDREYHGAVRVETSTR